jgi:magnesium transporter
VSCLGRMPVERSAAILTHLPVETAATLIRRLSAESHQGIVAQLPEQIARAVQLLLRYAQNSAGSLMNPLVQVIPDDITVAEALTLVRRLPQNLYYYLYTVDRSHKLTGVLDIRELMLAQPEASLRSITKTDVARLPAGADLRGIIAHPGWREFDALPVVDEHDVFLGVIRNKVVRALEPGAKPEGQTGLQLVVTLGETYWMALRELFDGVASSFARHHHQEDSHHG